MWKFLREMCLQCIMLDAEGAPVQFSLISGYRKKFKDNEHINLSCVSWDLGGRHAFYQVLKFENALSLS